LKLFWAKECKPLEIVPMGTEADIPNDTADKYLGLPVEKLHLHGLDSFIQICRLVVLS
jgi:hypothetical protein